MLENLINSPKYKNFTSTQVKDLLNYLVGEKIEFSLTANTKGVDFNPQIPESIANSFSQFTLFNLANYTFESIVIEEDIISFEAGFGSENFGSVCTIPFYAVFQISIDNSILFINPSATIEKYFNEDKSQEKQKERSMNAFHLNK